MRKPGQATTTDKVLAIIRASFGDELNTKIDNADSELEQHARFIDDEPKPISDESKYLYLSLLALGKMHADTERMREELTSGKPD